MPKKPAAKAAAERAIVAAGIIAGKKSDTIGKEAGLSQRTVQRITAESETVFLITEAFRPQQRRLLAMAAKAVKVVQEGMSAKKYFIAGKDDYRLRGDAIARLKAVEMYTELMSLAQGKVAIEPQVDETVMPKYTWEELTVLYKKRKGAVGETPQANP